MNIADSHRGIGLLNSSKQRSNQTFSPHLTERQKNRELNSL
jgi:hypothetical protein